MARTSPAAKVGPKAVHERHRVLRIDLRDYHHATIRIGREGDLHAGEAAVGAIAQALVECGSFECGEPKAMGE